jgi:TonB family protein
MPKEFFKSFLWAIGLHGILLGILIFTWPFLAHSVFSFDQYRIYKISLVSSLPSFQSTQRETKTKSPLRQFEPQKKGNSHSELTSLVPKETTSQAEGIIMPAEKKEGQRESDLEISFLLQAGWPVNPSDENGGEGSGHQRGNSKDTQASLHQARGSATASTLARPRYSQNREPYYPVQAREQGWQGTALLKVQVLKNGAVGSLEVLHSSGFSILDQSALKGVKEWKFIPAQKDGQPAEMFVQLPVTFMLE